MLRNPRLMRLGLGIGLASVLLATLVWGAFQPWAANHFGYALPGPDRLPNRISYAGRQYQNPSECAGDTWCQPATRHCISSRQLRDQGRWPLRQVGSIPTLFGTAHPIFAPPHDGQAFLLVLDGDDCYLTYSLVTEP